MRWPWQKKRETFIFMGEEYDADEYMLVPDPNDVPPFDFPIDENWVQDKTVVRRLK